VHNDQELSFANGRYGASQIDVNIKFVPLSSGLGNNGNVVNYVMYRTDRNVCHD